MFMGEMCTCLLLQSNGNKYDGQYQVLVMIIWRLVSIEHINLQLEHCVLSFDWFDVHASVWCVWLVVLFVSAQ